MRKISVRTGVLTASIAILSAVGLTATALAKDTVDGWVHLTGFGVKSAQAIYQVGAVGLNTGGLVTLPQAEGSTKYLGIGMLSPATQGWKQLKIPKDLAKSGLHWIYTLSNGFVAVSNANSAWRWSNGKWMAFPVPPSGASAITQISSLSSTNTLVETNNHLWLLDGSEQYKKIWSNGVGKLKLPIALRAEPNASLSKTNRLISDPDLGARITQTFVLANGQLVGEFQLSPKNPNLLGSYGHWFFRWDNPGWTAYPLGSKLRKVFLDPRGFPPIVGVTPFSDQILLSFETSSENFITLLAGNIQHGWHRLSPDPPLQFNTALSFISDSPESATLYAIGQPIGSLSGSIALWRWTDAKWTPVPIPKAIEWAVYSSNYEAGAFAGNGLYVYSTVNSPGSIWTYRPS